MIVDYSTTVWNESQSKALMQLKEWFMFGGQVIRLGGLAGTGKTHLTGYIPELLGVRVQFCAPTGRAASVLKRKTGLETRTVHSLLRYGPQGTEHDEGCDGGTGCVCSASGDFVKLADTTDSMWGGSIIVVDEASMINSRMWQELQALGARIIAVGDYGQLPPVGESGFCVVAEENLDIKLTEIVRQAEGNPIIETAWSVRQGGAWPTGRREAETGSVTVLERPLRAVKVAHKEGRVILCATNRQRVKRNKEIRARLGLPEEPTVGDVVVNLRNDPIRGVMNGERGTVVKVAPGRDENMWFMVVEMESGIKYVGDVVKAQFNNPQGLANQHGGLFDFGYAMSVHKFQGSESPEVLVIAENLSWMPGSEKRLWRYTAATRAKEHLTVVVPQSEGY
jgi:exodeoxyribonuclease V